MILHNSIKVAHINCVRLTYSVRNSLMQLDYNESLELANWLILLNSVESPESSEGEQYSCSPKHYRYSGSPEHKHCLGSTKEKDNAANAALEMMLFLIHEENQSVAKLQDNQLSLSEPVRQPSLRGSVRRLCGSLSPAQNLQVTESHSQNLPEITGVDLQPFGSAPTGFSQADRNKSCSLLPHRGMELEQDLKIKTAIINTANAKTIFFIAYPFGSMSRAFSSLRITRLIQAASDSSPSCLCASSIKSRSSGSSRNWNGGLPRRSFLCVDTLSTPDVVCLCVMTHYMHVIEKATPQSAETLLRRLTTTVNVDNEAAMKEHTQTSAAINTNLFPQRFNWRFLALSVSESNIIHIIASSEREARDQSPAGCVMVFAGRLPASEVNHA